MRSREFLSRIVIVSMFPTALMRLEMKFSSSLLFLIIVWYLYWMTSSLIKMSMISGIWSDG